MNVRPLLFVGLVGAAVLLYSRRASAASSLPWTFAMSTAYTPPASASKYLAMIAAAEDKFGIPRHLLTRLLEIESGYRPDVIDGRVKSKTGATGIAQVLRSTAKDPGYGLRPLTVTANGLAPDERTNPAIAIPWAAEYLRAMYDRTGSWRQASAAYNQGLGNVLKARRIDPINWVQHVALEGRNYVAKIPDRIGVA